MQAKKINNNHWVIRLQRGEDVIFFLKKFCTEKKIYGGFFFGLGAVDRVELGQYDVDKKEFKKKELEEVFEVLNITGSIGKEKEIIIHAHITLGDKKMRSLGGHLLEGRVSGTMELFLTKLPVLYKKDDPETGLKVFEMDSIK